MPSVLRFAPLLLSAAAFAVPARAGDYYERGYYGYGRDCADNWRFCEPEAEGVDRSYSYSDDYYGNCDGCRRGYYGRRYYRDGDYDRGYGSYDLYVVCDPDGDRCYRSSRPYWNYRTYYRRHGYHRLD